MPRGWTSWGQLDGPDAGEHGKQLTGEGQVFIQVQQSEAAQQRRRQSKALPVGMALHPFGRQEGGPGDDHQQGQIFGHAQQIKQPAGRQKQRISSALRHQSMAHRRQRQQGDVFQGIWHHYSFPPLCRFPCDYIIYFPNYNKKGQAFACPSWVPGVMNYLMLGYSLMV